MSLIVAVNKTYHSYFSPKHLGTLNPKKKFKAIKSHNRDIANKIKSYDEVKDHKNSGRTHFYAKDLMNPNIHFVSPNDIIDKAVQKMSQLLIHHLIVLEDHEVVGLVSDRDLLKSIHTTKNHIREIMNEKVLLCHSQTEIRLIAKVLYEEQISSIVVVDENHKPLGIITRSDLLNFIVQQMPLELWG